MSRSSILRSRTIGSLLRVAGVMLVPVALCVPAQDYELDWTTIDNGGGASSDGYFQLTTTIGQPDTGASTDSNGVYQLEAGFWPAGLTAPPSLLSPLPDLEVHFGDLVEFEPPIVGTPPFRYQWRLNGVNLPGQTNASLTLTNVQLEDSGRYTVGILNQDGFIESEPGSLTFTLPAQRAEDAFSDRVPLPLDGPILSTNNLLATREEPCELFHAGLLSGASVWYSWSTNAGGIATFATTGSEFDTLLAVYTGDGLEALVPVAADDDRGGFLTSRVQFNVEPGVVYNITVDGVGARTGRFVLSWSFEETSDRLPEIVSHPASQAIQRGESAMFAVSGNEPNLTYQWLFNGHPIPSQTAATLNINNSQSGDLGFYTVTLTNPDGRTVESLPASLEFGGMPGVVTYGKLEEMIVATGLVSGGNCTALTGGLQEASLDSPTSGGTFYPASLGSASVHEFTTGDKPKAVCEDCGVVSATSRFFEIAIQQSGLLRVSTLGSTTADGAPLNTILAVHDVGNFGNLYEFFPCDTMIGICDDNSGPDGSSYLEVPVQAGMTVGIAAGSVDGMEGDIVVADWKLCPFPSVVRYIGNNLFLTGPINSNPYPTNGGAVYYWYTNGYASDNLFAMTSEPLLPLDDIFGLATTFTMRTLTESVSNGTASYLNQLIDFGALVSIESRLVPSPPGAGAPASFLMILKGLEPGIPVTVETMMQPLTNCVVPFAWQLLPEDSYQTTYDNEAGALHLELPIDQPSRIFRLAPAPPFPTAAAAP